MQRLYQGKHQMKVNFIIIGLTLCSYLPDVICMPCDGWLNKVQQLTQHLRV